VGYSTDGCNTLGLESECCNLRPLPCPFLIRSLFCDTRAFVAIWHVTIEIGPVATRIIDCSVPGGMIVAAYAVQPTWSQIYAVA
jgi:hypothetical protein